MLRVMIVDDEPFIREGLKVLIDWNQEGFKVVAEARNAFEAMEILKKDQFDLFLIDIKMPKMNGIELSRYIRDKVSKRVSIVFLTGYLELEYVNNAFDVNAVQYLLKPIQPENLTKLLREIRAKIEKVQEEDKIRKKNAKNLREYYIVELLHGVKRQENMQYLRKLFWGEKEIYYVQLSFFAPKKLEMDEEDMNEQMTVLKQRFQMHLQERSYCVVSLASSQHEYALGIIVIGQMLQERRMSIYEVVDYILGELPQITQMNCVAKLGHCVDDICKLNESYKDAMKAVPYMLKSKEVPLEVRLNSYLQAHYMENISLKALSETFYVNAAYLGQFFKKHNGVYLKDYLNSIRVKKGAELLLNSPMKIYQIAERVGFQSADSFISAFSKEMEVTPQRFRQEKMRSADREVE